MIDRRTLLRAASVTAAIGPFAVAAQAPRPLARIIVGFPPGGTADVIGRALADKLRGNYATNLIVENKPGARGSVASSALLASEPDGQVIYIAPHSMVTMYPHVYRKLNYDPVLDLIPAATLGSFEFALSVSQALPVRTLAEFVQWAKANKNAAAYGSLGNGTTAHFLGVMFAGAAGIDWNHIPYKGAGPGVQDLLAGQIPSLIGPVGDIAVHHRAGKVRVLATTGAKRSRFLPEVPTFDEAGYKGLLATERFGVFLRRDSAPALVQRVNRDVNQALAQEDFRATLLKLSYEPLTTTPQEFGAIIKS
ncbi:MAG: tripartite tricarboxylate transporter substrate-binding protein, partial [Burkholderiaceae bacterium]|nr:tripartite tricarboxylate transporter substrate-binding protein [Burkholderiaceae bacterium]